MTAREKAQINLSIRHCERILKLLTPPPDVVTARAATIDLLNQLNALEVQYLVESNSLSQLYRDN